MFVEDAASETPHKAPAPLLHALLMKWRPLHSTDHSKLSQPIADDPYQRTSKALSAPAPPLRRDLLHNLLKKMGYAKWHFHHYNIDFTIRGGTSIQRVE